MKKLNTTLKVLTTGILFLCFTSAFSQQTADPLANQKTKCILQYLSSLPSLPNNKVISGQWTNYRGLPNTPQTEFDTAITSVYNQTSKWVGIMGTTYMRQHTGPYGNWIDDLNSVNKTLINYSNQNGLVSVMIHWNNPWTGGGTGDMTSSSNLLDIITSGTPANINFLKDLDSIAVGFSQLQDSNVTVLFRPFHEMNAGWFWWGSKSTTLPIASDFTSLWQFTFDYLTTTKNLHNILWYYTPSARESNVSNLAFKTELFYYPGINYVDIIGLDIYNDTLDIPNYSALIATGKPLGLSEFGPKKSTVNNLPNVYDYTILINQIKTKYPAIGHWISWNHFQSGATNTWIYYSLSTQNNTSNLLNDSWVINRDEIDYSNCLTTSINETDYSSSVNIFPNPTSSTLHFSEELTSGEIYNGIGQLVWVFNTPLNSISVENFNNGIYFIKSGSTTKKFIVKH